MRRLAEAVDLSERQLRRRFKLQAGLGIKTYMRLTRLQRVPDASRRRKRRPSDLDVSWADLSYSAGYADQSHMIRDVNTLTGLTPAALLEDL